MIDIKKNPEAVGKLKVGTSAATPASGEVVADKVGVGVAPAAPLHAKVAATTGSSPLEVARLEVEDNGSGVNMNAGMGPKLAFYMPHNAASFEGAAIYAKKEDDSDTNEATSLSFSTIPDAFNSPVERLTIDSTGQSTFTRDGGLVITSNRTTSDGDAIHVRKDNYTRLRLGTLGITFPNGSGAAPTAAAANQLDYYEEGTWTPVHAAAGSTSGTWNSTLTGTYTRIGDLVSVNLRITGTSMDFSSVSGYRGYSGLPFAPASDAAGSYDSFHTTSTIGTAAAFTTGSTLYLHPARIGTGTSVIFATVQYKV